MNLTNKIASRFLSFNKWQTVIIALGVGIGVAAQMFVGLLIDSLQANLIKQTVGSSPHISITHQESNEFIKNPEKIISNIKSVDEIEKIEIVTQNNALLQSKEKNFPILFFGFESDSQDLYKIKENIIDGKYFSNNNEVVIGSSLLDEIEKKVGDDIQIIDGVGGQARYSISGVFSIGVEAIDNTWLIGSRETVQNFFGLDRRASAIQIQVEDVFGVQEVQKKLISKIRDENITITNWQETNAQLLNALSSQSSSSFMIQFFVLVSVLVAITSILSITVLQKSRQIGILKAMGLTDIDARNIFIKSSFVIGFLGSTLGLLMGFGLFFLFINAVTNTDGSRLFEPNIRWVFVLTTYFLTIIAATTAGYIPAKKSENIDPIEIIQNE